LVENESRILQIIENNEKDKKKKKTDTNGNGHGLK